MKRIRARIPFAGSQLDETRDVNALLKRDEDEHWVLLPLIQHWFQCGRKKERAL